MSIEITPRDQAMASAIAGLIQKEASLDDVKKAAGNAADKIESMAKSTADVVKDGYNKVEEKASAKFRPVLAKLKAMFEQGKKTESAPTKKSEKDGKQVPVAKAGAEKEAAGGFFSNTARWPFKAAIPLAIGGGLVASYPAWKRMLWGDVTRQRYGSENWKNKVMQEYQLKKDEQEEKMRKYVGENFIPDQFGGYTNPQTGTIMGPRAMHARVGFMNQQAQGARDAWIRQQFNSMRRQELAGHTSVPEKYQTGLDKVFEDFKTKYNAPMEGAGGSDPKSWKAFAKHLMGNPGMYRGVPYFRGWNPQTLSEAELREKFEGMIPGRGSV